MPASNAAMADRRPVASAADRAYGFLIVLMAALAGGMVWAAAALYLLRPLPFLAVALGALVGCVTRFAGFGGTISGAMTAGLMTVVASVYALALNASTLVALAMGFNYLDTLRSIGPEMAFAVVWARLTPVDIACIAGAAVVAIVISSLRGRG